MMMRAANLAYSDSRRRASSQVVSMTTWGVAGAILLCIAVGWATVHVPQSMFFALLAVGAIGLLARWNIGVATGFALLLVLGGVPFVSTQVGATDASGSNAINAAVVGGIALALVIFMLGIEHRVLNRRLATWILLWAGIFLAWWLIGVTLLSQGVPLFPAVKYGRAFLYFGVLCPLLVLALQDRAHLIGFGATLAAGAFLFAAGQIAVQLIGVDLGPVLHIDYVREVQGVTRIYSSMGELLLAVFPFSLGVAVLGSSRWRGPAIAVATVTGLATALSFSRAAYVAVLVAIAAVSLFWIQDSGWQARRIRVLASTGVGIALVMAIVLPAVSRDAQSPAAGSAVIQRATAGVEEVRENAGTFGYRVRLAHAELHVLGDDWLTGLGFLDPRYRYFPDLPEGSIRNVDLGALGVLMTMGLIGVILIYAPLVGTLVLLLRRRWGAVQYGGALYAMAAVVSSITLGTMATVPGLLVQAAMLAICLNATFLGQSGRSRASGDGEGA